MPRRHAASMSCNRGFCLESKIKHGITAIKNNALAEIKTSGEEGEIHNLPMKRFVGHTEIEEDGLEICLYFPNMSEKTREKFVEAFND